MTRERESIDLKAQKEREALVRFYGENENMLRQAIKDFENRIAVKTEAIEMDREILKLLIDNLNSGKRNRD